MAENLNIHTGSKTDKYNTVIPQIRALVDGEPNLIANLANIAAALRQTFNWFWTGFYLVDGDQLVLGPFQGDIACTRINLGKGVCGTSWQDKKTLIVANVEEFPGHIACSALSKSEIVVPIIKDDKVLMVLDVDSSNFDDFDTIDKKNLEEVAAIIIDLI